jgi:hypothetical protein
MRPAAAPARSIVCLSPSLSPIAPEDDLETCPMRDWIRCDFRRNVKRIGPTEVASCALLERITGLAGSELCQVQVDACKACSTSFQPSVQEINPVVASLLYNLTSQVVARGGTAGCNRRRARRLQAWAEECVARTVAGPPGGVRCDIVMCCADSSELTDRAIRSALDQEGANIVLHLVQNGGQAAELVARYELDGRVVLHPNEAARGTFETLHRLVPFLKTDFVAVQDPQAVSHPERIRNSVWALAEQGADILAASVNTPAGTIQSQEPGTHFRRYVPPQSFVFRRASLVDIGGFADCARDADIEFLARARRNGLKLTLLREPTVTYFGGSSARAAGFPSPTEPAGARFESEGRGFPSRSVACDVVLPFHGQLYYVRQAIESILEQEGAEAIVHLVDDASPEDAYEVLRYWITHPRVRIYRNVRNLGQFISFNNVSPYLETDLVAVQDADDISLPDRLHRGGNLLTLSAADIFGGHARVFGDGIASGSTPTERSDRPRSAAAALEQPSRYPRPGERGYFLQNPTAMMRVSCFKSLRGFSDYGDLERNKCGLDTEFYVRAYCAGARFAISRKIVLNYRRHAASATHNAQTGWGTAPRSWTEAENQRRFALLHAASCHPGEFGALGNHAGLTERLNRD